MNLRPFGPEGQFFTLVSPETSWIIYFSVGSNRIQKNNPRRYFAGRIRPLVFYPIPADIVRECALVSGQRGVDLTISEYAVRWEDRFGYRGTLAGCLQVFSGVRSFSSLSIISHPSPMKLDLEI